MFLLVVYKRFAQDLIRQTCADLYFEPSVVDSSIRKPSLGLVNLGEIKFPTCLNVKDVYRTIMRHDRFDFLTNKYMGVYVEENETSKQTIGQNGRLKKNFSDSSLVNNK